ncbi:MAG: L,D-transpeptidase family protein [Alphaproteobacteria bacterium]
MKIVTAILALAVAAGTFGGPAPQAAPWDRAAVLEKMQPLLARAQAEAGAPVFIRIFKRESELELWLKGESGYGLVKTYPICAWSGHLGPKLKQGDRQAPEGFYRVVARALNPASRFHLSFNLGYPNEYDRAHGRTGDWLMVHGNCVSIGCYAMTDRGIEEIYTLVEAALENGQPAVPVHIFPFRMTDANMARASRSRWIGFWRNLKTGYDLFERTKRPPDVRVRNKAYVFPGETGVPGSNRK